MSKFHLCALLLTLLGATPQKEGDSGVEPALSNLMAARAEERTEAQRELTALLRLSHLDLVTRAVLDSAEPELRWRLAEAIAGDGRADAERLELASLLAGADPREGPRAVGSQALESLGLRWSPDAREKLESRGRTQEELAKTSLLRWSFDPGRTLGPQAARSLSQSFYTETLLERAVDSLARHCGEGARLIITPEAAQIARDFERALAGLTSTPEDPERFRGSCIELLGVLSERYGLELEGHGIERGAPIVLLRERREANVDRSLLRLLVRWVRVLQTPESSQESRRDAARALAASGWPAALEWLTWRAFERSDAAAFDGVLLAAGRGVAAPQLIRANGQERLLRLLDQAGSPKARIARALGVFPGVDARGRALAPALFEGYTQLAADLRFSRLLVAEMRSSRASIAVEAAAHELSTGRATASPWLALQALRTLAALGEGELPEGCVVPTEELLLQLASEPSGAGDFAVLGAYFGLAPPRRLEVRSVAPEAQGRAFEAWMGWLFDTGERSDPAIVEALGALEAAGESWSRVLRRERALGRTETALARTLELAELARREGEEGIAAALERSLLLAGVADRDQAVRLGNGLLRSLSVEAELSQSPPEDLAVLGALVAGPLGREATEKLADLVRGADALEPPQLEALVRGARRARSEFLSAGLEGRAQALNTSLRLASGSRSHPLRRAFRAPLWPPPELPRAIPLESLERQFP